MPVGLGVLFPAVVQMAAYREDIDHKLVLLDKLGHDFFHHLQIRGGLDFFQIQPIAHGIVLIAHVGVGQVPVVIGIQIVVVGQGPVAQGAELVAEAEGHVVVGGLRVTPNSRLGNQTCGGHIFPV